MAISPLSKADGFNTNDNPTSMRPPPAVIASPSMSTASIKSPAMKLVPANELMSAAVSASSTESFATSNPPAAMQQLKSVFVVPTASTMKPSKVSSSIDPTKSVPRGKPEYLAPPLSSRTTSNCPLKLMPSAWATEQTQARHRLCTTMVTIRGTVVGVFIFSHSQ